MDIMFFLTGCLSLAETIALFRNKDFIIFFKNSVDPEEYDLGKVYAVERWLFAVDTIALFSIALHVGGQPGIYIMIAIAFATLGGHLYVFRSPKFRAGKRSGKRSIAEKARGKKN